MSETQDSVVPDFSGRKCVKCGVPAEVKNGHSYYCARHRRFQQMLCTAKYDGKLVPPAGWLEANIPEGMTCPVCQRTMNWLRKDGGSTVISLQHDRDGVMRFLCHGCNVKHSKMPGDSYYTLPEGHKRCPICTEIKPLGDFSSTNNACRPCCRATANARRAADPEAAKMKSRAYAEANSETLKAYRKAYHIANREVICARVRAWYARKKLARNPGAEK